MGKYRYDKERYVEDSTRGKAVSNPRTYKRDALVQVWIDRRKLAMLSEWLDNNGFVTKHLSDVLRGTIDAIVGQLVDNGSVEKVELTEDAVRILDMKYKVDLNPRGKGLRNLTHNLQLDEIRKSNRFEHEINQPISEDNEYEEAKSFARRQAEKVREMEESGELEERLSEVRRKRDEEDIGQQRKNLL